MPAFSYLFVPGDRPERFAKALASGADALIVDLEDAVAPAAKPSAREAVAQWLRTAPAGVIVRVNPPDTPWHADDCALLASPSVHGVMLPKAQEVRDVAALAARLRADQQLLPLIESVAGYFEAGAIAAVPGVSRLAFGSFDFMADAGIQADGEELDAVRTQLVLLSRRADLPAPVDGVSLAIDEPAQLLRDVRRARRFGMGAKLCIHPRQVAAVNEGFAPTEAELAWAARVVRALHEAAGGAVAVDGKLVDRPVALRAEALLRDAAERGAAAPAAD